MLSPHNSIASAHVYVVEGVLIDAEDLNRSVGLVGDANVVSEDIAIGSPIA
jgi:hypothetical protein